MRNNSLDILKFVCAVAVVFLHGNTPLKVYNLIPLARFAVPCFFIISGYFLMGENMDARMTKGVRKILKITVYSSILYAVVQFVRHRFEISSIIPSAEDFVAFVLLNDNPWGFHLWYLTAYLYTLMICIYLFRKGKLNLAFYFVPILLVVDLVLGKYSLLILNMEFPYIVVRNFLFEGLPYFLIGAYIKQHEKSFLYNKELFLGGAVLFAFTSILENRLLVHLDLNAARDHYLSTTPLSILIFLLFLNFKSVKSTIFSRIGKDDSLYIYILHPLWIFFFKIANPYLPTIWTESIYNYLAPLLILTCTILLTSFLRKVKLIS